MTDPQELDPEMLAAFGAKLQERAVSYHEDAISLRAGGESHWYVDVRAGLANGLMFRTVGQLLVAKARSVGIKAEVVAGMGLGGYPVCTAYGLAADGEVQMAWIDDKHDPSDPRAYGVHGARMSKITELGDVEPKMVLGVDDTLTTGDSLITMNQMIRDAGGEVYHNLVIVDRSRGVAQEALAETGVEVHALFEYDQDKHILLPVGQSR